MTTDELDPLIHVPTRLKIVATLAALPDGDTLSFTRLQDMIGLPPRQPDHPPAQARRSRLHQQQEDQQRVVSITTVALTGHGRAALDSYTRALRDLLDGL